MVSRSAARTPPSTRAGGQDDGSLNKLPQLIDRQSHPKVIGVSRQGVHVVVVVIDGWLGPAAFENKPNVETHPLPALMKAMGGHFPFTIMHVAIDK